METDTKKACFGFSWADEVEREEQEREDKADREEHPIRKSNPFGDARPREVVLEEKGVDWRKIDLGLDHRSVPRKDKKPKENISLSIPSKCRQEHISLGKKSLNKLLTQATSNLVPPLRYPPKNIMAVMEQIRRGHTDRLDLGRDNSHQDRCSLKSGIDRDTRLMDYNGSLANFNTRELIPHWQMDVAYPLTTHAHYNLNSVIMSARENIALGNRTCFRERNVNINEQEQASRGRQVLVDLNCGRATVKNYCKDVGAYHEDYVGHGSRRSFFQEQNFINATELQMNGRREACGNFKMGKAAACGDNYNHGKEHYWEYNGDGTGTRKYNEGLLCPPVECHQIFGMRKGICDGEGRKAASAVSVHGGRGVVSKEAGGSIDNYKRKRGTFSALQHGPSHQSRQRKQARK